MAPDVEEHARAILFQLELGKKQMEQLGKQEQMIEGAILEINSTIDALNTIKNQKSGDEIMVQVGAGSFMKAKLIDTGNVLVGVGAGISIEKKLPDAVAIMQERGEKLSESMKSVRKTMGELAIRISELNRQAQQMMGPMN